MLLKNISELHKQLDNNDCRVVGLIPTMGALHQGHLSLIEQAKKECDCIVVSIFVNPTQFNDASDLLKYPRTLDEDMKKIRGISEHILVYVPLVDEIYPNGPKSKHFDFGTLSIYMEGQYRKGHFDGVATVLKRLFELVEPQKAYFGEKDYQQLAIVRKLTEMIDTKVEIIGCNTYREPYGLAKSSRNKLLNDDEKNKAVIIYQSLKLARTYFEKLSIPEIKKMVKSSFKTLENVKLEYFEIAAEDDLVPVENIQKDKKYRAFIAAYYNEVRLIDNIVLN